MMRVFNSGSYLEEVTGLSELHLTAEMTDVSVSYVVMQYTSACVIKITIVRLVKNNVVHKIAC